MGKGLYQARMNEDKPCRALDGASLAIAPAA